MEEACRRQGGQVECVNAIDASNMAPTTQGDDGRVDDASTLSAEDRLRVTYPSAPTLRNLTSETWSRPAPVSNPALQSLGAPHVGSFNYMLGDGLRRAVADIPAVEFTAREGVRISLKVTDCSIEAPRVPPGAAHVSDPRVFPSEARQKYGSYKGRCAIRFTYAVNGRDQAPTDKYLGHLPIMLRSDACNTGGLSPADLIRRGEQEQEWGGYFVVGGHERIIRMLQTTRRNYPIAMSRPSWKNRGRNFSDLGVLLECGKADLTTTKNVMHFVTTGTAKFMFSLGRELFFVSAVMVLKCLSDRSDAGVFAELTAGCDPDDHYYVGCVKNMLAEPHEEGLYSSQQVRQYIGRSFREKLSHTLPDWLSDEEVCAEIMRRAVCIHLDDPEDKFQVVCLMAKKLFSLAQDRCAVEGVDSVMMHEIVLGGHLYLQLLKEKLERWTYSLKAAILKKAKDAGAGFELTPKVMDSCLTKTLTLERMFENFLGTGNLPSESGLGLMQDKGLTIMAENINRMRYMSHFRAIHRGSFFQEMRTTEVRALLPDAWGFVCPVHTPDGAPCGLLNHLAFPVEIVTHAQDNSRIPEVLVALGMSPVGDVPSRVLRSSYPVLLDGRVLGFVPKKAAAAVVDKLRVLKVRSDDDRVPKVTEIVLVPDRSRVGAGASSGPGSAASAGQYPGLFLFTGPARMVRPVVNLALNAIELIGTFEQVYLDIAVATEESYSGVTTHQEIRQTSFLSNLACTIPLPDFNQSPRNMYQCQMGKQTMATPTHTWHLNSETKMYRLQTPTSPFFRPAHYDHIGMDDYPMGTNAIVAVISYTGYDMEDAMIINKSSYERGFAAGCIYKSTIVDLREIATGRKNPRRDTNGADDLLFGRDPKRPDLALTLDVDGLPYVGTRLEDGDPLYCYCNPAEGVYVVKKFEGKEAVYVDAVKLCGNDLGTSARNRACISYRVPRNPSVGDKFASRAGQKGICSRLWPVEDLPWTESGLVPDIVFNPHGFPSRMTIAMMIECMAGKAGAVHGQVHDATPFRFGEGGAGGSDGRTPDDAIDYFARHLEEAGYNYYGTETLYSGTDGVEMKAEIFFGIIHYQRLRHMVSDKFQVRSTGAVDQITRQPIKGRRRGGGVRFGEMERDSLLSHGAVFLLQDRLFHGSDKTRVKICTGCGSLISPRVMLPANSNADGTPRKQQQVASRFRELRSRCVTCPRGGDDEDLVREVELPYIFLHLVWQLAAVNIKIVLKTSHQ